MLETILCDIFIIVFGFIVLADPGLAMWVLIHAIANW